MKHLLFILALAGALVGCEKSRPSATGAADGAADDGARGSNNGLCRDARFDERIAAYESTFLAVAKESACVGCHAGDNPSAGTSVFHSAGGEVGYRFARNLVSFSNAAQSSAVRKVVVLRHNCLDCDAVGNKLKTAIESWGNQERTLGPALTNCTVVGADGRKKFQVVTEPFTVTKSLFTPEQPVVLARWNMAAAKANPDLGEGGQKAAVELSFRLGPDGTSLRVYGLKFAVPKTLRVVSPTLVRNGEVMASKLEEVSVVLPPTAVVSGTALRSRPVHRLFLSAAGLNVTKGDTFQVAAQFEETSDDPNAADNLAKLHYDYRCSYLWTVTQANGAQASCVNCHEVQTSTNSAALSKWAFDRNDFFQNCVTLADSVYVNRGAYLDSSLINLKNSHPGVPYPDFNEMAKSWLAEETAQ